MKPKLLVIGLFVATALMLTVIGAPIDFSAPAWVALVPLVIACSPQSKPGGLALAAYLVSLVYWLVNLYWIAPITIVGWIAFCAFSAILWPILALCLRYCRAKSLPLALLVPILIVGAERLQGWPLGGFFWRFLGHSQYRNITIIQIADIFGAAGVSFLVAAVNGLLAEVLLGAWRIRDAHRPSRPAEPPTWQRLLGPRYVFQLMLVTIALVAAILYGRYRREQTDRCVTMGPLVAALQSNVPQSVKRSFESGDEMFDELLEHSKAAAEQGAQVIVWPETMAQAILDHEIWPYLVDANDNRAYDARLGELARDTAYVFVGAYGGRIVSDPAGNLSLDRFNSAFLYRPDGRQDPNRYDKIHLVLFGEYLPFKKSCQWLYNLLMKFTPYNYDYSLTPGTEHTVFLMSPVHAHPIWHGPQPIEPADTGPPEPLRFGAIICYEDSIPEMARRCAVDEAGKKRVDWLINISNDGWFVLFRDDPPRTIGTAELPQHAAICAFRAVENRLAILRSVNGGISCLIDSAGRIRDGYLAASGGLPVKAMARKGIAGWFLDRMPIDKRVTLFSRYGQWLDGCCALCLAGLTALLIVTGLIGRRNRTPRRVTAK